MITSDYWVYAAHAAFWIAFVATRWLVARHTEPAGASVTEPVSAETPEVAPWSRTVLAVHFVAFGVLYFGIAAAVIPGLVPHWFAGQAVIGAIVIGAGAFAACAALATFASWRFRAKLDTGHQLATHGIFRWIRNPIYLGLNLLALGSALWVPTVIVWGGALLMLVGSDLRARAEERVLARAFGVEYEAYRHRSWRFVPGVY